MSAAARLLANGAAIGHNLIMADVGPIDLFLDGRAVLVETSNPHDPTAEDLRELLLEVRAAANAFGVKVFHVPDEVHGSGTTLWHMVYLWLPDAELLKDEVYGAISTAAIAYLHRWRKRRPKERSRPGEVRILYGPNGEVLRRVTMPADDEAVVVSDNEDRTEPRSMRFMRRRHSG